MSRRRYETEDEETSYWLSYSDMMAGLLLVFVLIITFTMLQAKWQYEEKVRELEAKQDLVEQQELLLEEQKSVMSEQQDVLNQQQKQLDQIIGVRGELIQALSEEFEGTDLKVSVDNQTGAISFDSSVLFDYNKSDIKEAGKEFLAGFLPRYFDVLLDSEFESYISEIIIEGHTDTNGDYLYNLNLSQKRALSVAAFCLEENNEFISNDEIFELRKIVTANGRSFSAPIYDENGVIDMAASRRVEFKFRLKDEEMINEMKNLLNTQ